MSAIFGYTFCNTAAKKQRDTLCELEYWNRAYGKAASDRMELDQQSGIGCLIEHFSEAFSWGGPILEAEGSFAVIDALLFNRDELINQLSCDPKISDEELLLGMIRSQGLDSLERINGDFAGAFYDPVQKTWTLFRDHMGVRPLYYYLDDDVFAFSTDIRGLTSICGERCPPNPELIYQELSGLNSRTLCNTEYAHIFCVRPGSYAQFHMDNGAFEHRESRYWRLNRKKIRLRTEKAYEDEMRRLITDSIRRRLDAVPGIVGAELSGGLDSSVISILIHRLGREACHYSWSVSPEIRPLRDGDDERKVILDICRQENTSCHFEDKSQLFQLQDILDQCFPAHTDTYSLSYGSRWMHAQGARCVFTGHGGDEGVSHRGNHYELFYHGEYFSYLRAYWEDYNGRKLRFLRAPIRAIYDLIGFRKLYSKPFYMSHFDAHELLSESFKAKISRSAKDKKIYFHYAPVLYIEQGGTRQRMDNAAFQGAFCGVRYLFPYVDYRVMDFAVSIPRYLYRTGRFDRKIFRNAFKDIIPTSLYNVFYKDYASERDIVSDPKRKQQTLIQALRIRELLDRDYWGDMLDWEYIDSLSLPNLDDPKAVHRFITAFSHLNRCLLIQNVATKALEVQRG